MGIPQGTIDQIKASLQPGTSATVAVVEERWVADLEESLRAAHAREVFDAKLASPSGSQAPSGTHPSNP